MTRRSADLSRREADVALRLARPIQTGLVARRVGTLGISLYASTGYLARHRAPPHVVVAADEISAGAPESTLLASIAWERSICSPPAPRCAGSAAPTRAPIERCG